MISAAATAASLAFAAPYAPDDAALIRGFIGRTQLDAAAEQRIDRLATRLIAAHRRTGFARAPDARGVRADPACRPLEG